jgi:DNA-binding CsgD family transcriptional regulator
MNKNVGSARIVVHARDPRLRAMIAERLADLGEVSMDGGAAVEVLDGSGAITPRETEVLGLMAEGLANKEIAARLGVSIHTAKFHVESLLRKLEAANRAEAVAEGMRRGLLEI